MMITVSLRALFMHIQTIRIISVGLGLCAYILALFLFFGLFARSRTPEDVPGGVVRPRRTVTYSAAGESEDAASSNYGFADLMRDLKKISPEAAERLASVQDDPARMKEELKALLKSVKDDHPQLVERMEQFVSPQK